MKKLLCVILSVIMLCTCLCFIAYCEEGQFEENGFSGMYSTGAFGGKINSLKYTGKNCEAYIPKTLHGVLLTDADIVGMSVFTNCNISSFTVDEDNAYFTTKDGVLFTKNEKTLIKYPEGKEGTSYEVPEGTEILDLDCFDLCKLTDITLPNTLKEIRHGTFDFLPESKFSLIDNVYYYGTVAVKVKNTRLEILKFREGTTLITDEILADSNDYLFVSVPESVNYIGKNAFFYLPEYFCGVKNSAIEKYAKSKKINFIDIGENHSHTYISYGDPLETCISNGVQKVGCPCGKILNEKTILKNRNSHCWNKNEKSDYVCSVCSITWQEYSDPSLRAKTCDCLCHKDIRALTGDFDFKTVITSVFYKVRLVFWRMTGTHKTCECGINHY